MKKHFLIYEDECFGSMVVFATDKEIADDAIIGEWMAYDPPAASFVWHARRKYQVDDACEDYAIVIDSSKIEEVTKLCIAAGFTENDDIKDCGWS